MTKGICGWNWGLCGATGHKIDVTFRPNKKFLLKVMPKWLRRPKKLTVNRQRDMTLEEFFYL